mmetsp:Transcript_10909/g.20866  ORF Transcript_10909/g.20866 Transcript_10909/m.20866 type:complete len:257 (-) Transcript_10909:229-999(-)
MFEAREMLELGYFVRMFEENRDERVRQKEDRLPKSRKAETALDYGMRKKRMRSAEGVCSMCFLEDATLCCVRTTWPLVPRVYSMNDIADIRLKTICEGLHRFRFVRGVVEVIAQFAFGVGLTCDFLEHRREILRKDMREREEERKGTPACKFDGHAVCAKCAEHYGTRCDDCGAWECPECTTDFATVRKFEMFAGQYPDPLPCPMKKELRRRTERRWGRTFSYDWHIVVGSQFARVSFEGIGVGARVGAGDGFWRR